MKMKITVKIDQINRSRCRTKYIKHKECIGKMMFTRIKKWGSMHENIKQNWDWDEKKALLVKKRVMLDHCLGSD